VRISDIQINNSRGKIVTLAHPSFIEIDFMQTLKVVDYGDASIDIFYIF